MAPEDSWIPKDQTGNPWHLNLQNKKILVKWVTILFIWQSSLLAPRRKGRLARRDICFSVTESLYRWHKIWLEALTGQYVVIVNIVLLFKKDRQKNKVTKVKNVNAMNLLQNGQFL